MLSNYHIVVLVLVEVVVQAHENRRRLCCLDRRRLHRCRQPGRGALKPGNDADASSDSSRGGGCTTFIPASFLLPPRGDGVGVGGDHISVFHVHGGGGGGGRSGGWIEFIGTAHASMGLESSPPDEIFWIGGQISHCDRDECRTNQSLMT